MEFKVGDLVRTLIEYEEVPVGYTETIVELLDDEYGYGVDCVLQGFPDVAFNRYELELVLIGDDQPTIKEPDLDKRASQALDDLLSGVFS